MKEYLKAAWERVWSENRSSIISVLESAETILDCGCDDGSFTMEAARATGAGRVLGVELDPGQAGIAASRGVDVTVADLNEGLAVDSDSVDVVLLNQVIEHLHDTDSIFSEARRVLKPGGILVISTENLSSWPNVISLLVGWQPFSLTNISEIEQGLGNPLAAHSGEPGVARGMRHLRIFAPRGLLELVKLHGFTVEKLSGVGYFPAVGKTASMLARLDYRHSALILLKARAPGGD